MKLDKFTFGNSPAALYLTLMLSELDDKKLLRKVSVFLHDRRQILGEVVACHYLSDELSVKCFTALLFLIQKDFVAAAADTFKNEEIKNLVVNILSAELNVYKKRTVVAVRINQRLAKGATEGVAVPMVKATPYLNEESHEDKNKRLTERSRAYLARAGKPNTLYQ